jgi:cytosine/adenosine deaminase-related metal-dependent hydrolase
MKEASLKLNKKEARILSSLLLATTLLVQMHFDEENNTRKRVEKGKYLQSLIDMKAKADLLFKKGEK